MAFDTIKLAELGEKITMGENGALNVPKQPIIPFIEGDGTGTDIWPAAQLVINAAVNKAYAGERQIVWLEVFAGEKAWNMHGQRDEAWLPEETLAAFRTYLLGMKGPLTTPTGGGIGSLNVALCQKLDLYTCLRPVKYFRGAPSPVKKPEDVDMLVFRENSEDIYTGIAWEAGSNEVAKVIQFFQEEMGVSTIRFAESSGIAIKAVSREGTERLVRAAIQYAIDNNRQSVSLVHQGNIMKFTEGAFMRWGYALAKEEFGAVEIDGGPWCKLANGIVIKDCIADIALQQVLMRATDFDVIATLNLNGDYLSDALAAQVGGIGIAPSANINYSTGHAIFEAAHGTAAKYAGKNMVNPSSLVLSGEMMLRYMGWDEAADLVVKGLKGAIQAKTVTYDFERLMDGAVKLSTSEFADAVVEHMDDAAISGEEADQYDALAAKFKELFEAGAEKSAEVAHISMEKAREQLTHAGEFTEEQGQKLKGFLERDLGQIASSVRDEAKLKLNPARLGHGALASISSLLQAAGSALSGAAAKADASLSCRSGEITSAGTLSCKACHHSMHFKKTGRIPPCPTCHKTDFTKGY